MSTWYSRPDAYPQYSHQYSQQYPQQQSGQQFTTTFSDQSLYPLMSPENSHLARAPMVKKSSDQIVTYAPSPAMEMPQGGVLQYGSGHCNEVPPSQSWARPPPHPPYSESDMIHLSDDERRGSLLQRSVKSESKWNQDYEADIGYYEPAHDNPALASVQPQVVSHTQSYSHLHELDGYQQSQEQYPFPQQAEHLQLPEHQPSFGMYSLRRRPQDQQRGPDAPYESFGEQWNGKVGVPECALCLQREEYGVLPAHHPEPEHHQTSAPMSYNNHAPNAYVQTQERHPHDYAGYAPNSPAMSSQGYLSYPSTSSTVIRSTSPRPTFTQTASQVGPVRRDLFAGQHRATGYQKALEAKHNAKCQLAFQPGEFETNHQTPTYAPVNSPRHQHHQQHQPQVLTSSFSGQSHTSHQPIAPPIVPSQAHEHSSPLTRGTDTVKKKNTPPKKPALACLFCRKRKITCGPPPPDSPDRTCNQCRRRKQSCEYPTESRRGIRKTPKAPVPEEPIVHIFEHGDPSLQDRFVAGRGRGRRKCGSE